ncbi:MAG: polymer-forming cytoskeletal protein [Rickettsiales bacterium]
MFGRLARNKHAVPGNPRKSASPSVIAADMNVLGNIVSDGVLDIDGQIEGNVRAHTVSIRPNGKIRGDVMAEVVMVHGTVEGLIRAQSVVVYASARIMGTIMHETLNIEDGAFIDGKCKRTERLAAAPAQLPGVRLPTIDSSLDSDNDNDEPPSEQEIRVLETLRLIS